MSTTKKIRGDSVLGTLPEERQAQIAEHATTHTLKETVAWLKAGGGGTSAGITISSGALSRWLSSFQLRRLFQMADADTTEFIRQLKERNPNLPESELQQFGAEYFQMQAVKIGDARTFLKFATARTKAQLDKAKLELKKGEAARDERRLRLLEQKAAQADAARQTLGDAKLSETEKQQRIRQIFGMA